MTDKTANDKTGLIILIEGLDRQGNLLLRQRAALTEAKKTLSIGTDHTADVMFDDAQMAPLHATLSVGADGRLTVTDLGSQHGVLVDGTRHRGGGEIALPTGTLQIGQTRLRAVIQREQDSKTEAPEPPVSRTPLYIAMGAGALSFASSTYDAWAESPIDLPVALLTALGFLATFSVIWLSLWAWLSRRSFGQSRWAHHSAIFFGIGIIGEFIVSSAPLVAFAVSAPWIAKLGGTTLWIGISVCAAVFLHLGIARRWTTRRRVMVALVSPLLFALVSTWIGSRWQRTDVNSMNADMRLYPPTFKIAGAVPSSKFFDEARTLKKKSDDRLKAIPKHLLDQYEDLADGSD